MLEINNLQKSFQRKIALDDISLSVGKAEIYGLLGPNGAGKTTLIRIINQIIEADSGTIRFNGQLMTQTQLAQIGYLPEERGLYKNMQVEEQLIFLAQLRGLTKNEAQRNVTHWLTKFGIQDWRSKRVESLSKGMAQKVQFIAALVHDPQLLVLDEPLSGFDPVNVELILTEMKELKASGKTIILSTHNMQSVDEICDRASLIHEAKKLAEDTVWNLREQHNQGEYSVRFKGNMIGFVNALWTDFELLGHEEIGDNRFMAKLKMRGASQMNDLINALVGKVELELIEKKLPSMQEVFIDIIRGKEEAHA
jgi:ABC-2 type transport system ATP-binding protein